MLLYLYTDDYDDCKVGEIWDPFASRIDASTMPGREYLSQSLGRGRYFLAPTSANGLLDTSSGRPTSTVMNAEATDHIRVYQAAESCEMPDLKSLAMVKYKSTDVDFKGAFDLLQSVYCAIPHAYDPLREIVFAQIAERIHWLIMQPEFTKDIVTHPVMLSDLFQTIVRHNVKHLAGFTEKLGNTSERLTNALTGLEQIQKTINNVTKCLNCPELYPPRLKRLKADDVCSLKAYCSGCGMAYSGVQEPAGR